MPVQHLFGSGELSMWSEGIAQRAPEPYVALSPADAGASARARATSSTCPSPTSCAACLCASTRACRRAWPACRPALRGLPGVALPAWIAPRFAARGTPCRDPFAGPLPPARDAGDSSFPPSDQDAPDA